jgi:hypothetical protein
MMYECPWGSGKVDSDAAACPRHHSAGCYKEAGMDSFIQVITTTEKREDAERIARELVEKRWPAACKSSGR